MLHTKHIRSLGRTAALLCAAALGLSLAGPLWSQSPVNTPNLSPAQPTPYSSPVFHSGGEFTPPLFIAPPPVPFPDPLYGQIQGTPTGLVPGTGANAGASVSTEIPSFLLGNYLPGFPPAAPGLYFPNHFRDGTAFSWSAPLTFTTPNAVAPATSPTGATPLVNIESTPTAVNISEFPFIAGSAVPLVQAVQYVGTTAGSASTPDTTLPSGSTAVPGLHSGSAPVGSPYLIRQVVYFGRAETVTTGTTAPFATTSVGAIYCVDGFTGEVIWRFQTPRIPDASYPSGYRDPSVFSTPAVAYMNVLTNAVTKTYANKAVVVVTDNNGFVYCLDAAGYGDGTSNSDAVDTAFTPARPRYLPQPAYGSAAPLTLPAHVGTTPVYWIYRPDVEVPNPSTTSSINFDPLTVLPVPGPFGLASPNVYVDRSASTTPDPITGQLPSNAVIYVGNTRDCVYALDGLGVANIRRPITGPLPAYNASLSPVVTGISDLMPTCNPRWWFTPDNASNNGLSFESTPSLSKLYPAAVIVTSSVNPATLNQGVTFTATVSDGTGEGGIPTGTIIFTVDGVAQAPVTLAPATVTTSTATSTSVPFAVGGPHKVTAAYSGDLTFRPSINTPAFDEQVESGVATSSNVVITSSANPCILGYVPLPGLPTTFTAKVFDGSGSGGTPTGSVVFTIGGIAQPSVPLIGGVATLSYTFYAKTGPTGVGAVYVPALVPPANFVPSSGTFEQYVYGPGPTVYIGSSQELGVGSNAGRLYAIDGGGGPTFAGQKFGGPGHALDQRAAWSFPNAYAKGGPTDVVPGNLNNLPSRPALGNVTGSPVVFTNTDVVLAAGTGVYGTPGYVPTQYQTRIYFAADSGLEVPYTATAPQQPNPRPATDTTGRIWAVETNGTTAVTGGTVWSFPQANDPNDPTKDNAAEPRPPIGSFLHSTPAIGVVQFPTTIQYGATPYTDYTHTDTINTTAAGVRGKSVPMLYVGTNGAADLGFYALDINGGNDTQRGVYRLESPTGSTFESSPILVTNSSTAGGNGGAVYATSGNSLLQVTATPISNVNTAQTFAFVGVDATFSGGGPISGPAVAAANTSDLPGTQTVGGVTSAAPFTLYGGKNATDFVYFGDGTLGFCRGITPIDPSYGGIVGAGTYGGVLEPQPIKQYSNKFFLQAYLFDGTTAHKATDPDMRNALGVNTKITGFEWGGFSYIRIGNVIPPCQNPASPTDDEVVADPTDPTLFYSNGQTVNFSIGNASVSVPPTTETALTGAYPEAAFTHRADKPVAGTLGNEPSTQLVTPTGTSAGLGWIAAYSYPIGADQTRIGDTPGAFRRVRQANQTATIYTKTGPGAYVNTGRIISLNMQTGIGSQYVATDAAGNKTIAQTPPMEQPTFGILNPLAVQGLGVPLGGTAAAPVTDNYGAGPFGAISSPTSPTVDDLGAFTNGSNRIPSLPKSGYDVTTESPTDVSGFVTGQAAFAQQPITIATAVGDIVDGTTGDNLDPATNTYALNVQNRSLVGTQFPAVFPPIPVAMQSVVAHWNDNTPSGVYPVGPPQNELGGPAATINPLPWEDLSSLSSVNANASLDYPDIPASAISHTLYTSAGGSSLNTPNGTAKLDGQTGPATGPTYLNLNHIKVAIAVPQHQPANLQIWDGAHKVPAPATSTALALAGTQAFPHGYIEGSGTGAGNSVGGGTPQRVFVDLSGRGQYNTIYPYRDVQTFAGVPVNMKTTTQTVTVGLENAPSALGIQTEFFTPPILPAGVPTPLRPLQTPPGLFNPYNPIFNPDPIGAGNYSFFKPVSVYNDGNTNLLNVHFGQQMNSTAVGNQTLYAVSDGNSLLSALGGFEFAGTSGPVNTSFQRTTTAGVVQNLAGTSIPEQSFLFRTSLDTDLMQAYGRNPQLAANYGALYPMGTFHKPRAGSGQPTTLTVPDVPELGDPAYTLPSAVAPTIGQTSAPYVGIALPFGTPVGTYKTLKPVPLRLFEGMDTAGSSPYLPPTYGNTVGGHIAPSAALTNLLPLGTNNQALVPVSSDGLDLQISVLEDRLTDGFTRGALPMVDSAPSGTASISTPDFAPAAFRDPSSKNISVYWTSGRGSGYGIYGANVPFASNGYGNYFTPNDGTKYWYGPVATPSLALGTNSGLSIVPGPNNKYYALAVNVAPTAPYNNTLYSYPIDPATGQVTAGAVGQPITRVPDQSQVKYGVKGVYTGFTDPVCAFWTASTRGRTTLNYSAYGSNGAGGLSWAAPATLPVPAGLTAVSDASPLLMPYAPVNSAYKPVIEVTYSGTGPDGNADLYVSRYVPGTTAATASQLNLVPFPAVTENLRQANGWYQGRDVAWSRSGALNLIVPVPDTAAGTLTTLLLYDGAGKPKFAKAIYDKASGYLVLTGVRVPTVGNSPALAQFTTNTVTVDAATGRVRFSPALLPSQTFAPIQATFSPLARRLTIDSRADTAPVTFMDTTQKANDGIGVTTSNTPVFPNVATDRRWTIWRKSGGAGNAATLYYKTQRLTVFLPNAIGLSAPALPATPAPLLTSVLLNGTDVTKQIDVDYARGRLYFPIALGAEGSSVVVKYTAANGAVYGGGGANPPAVTDTVQWQDEFLANDSKDVPPTGTAAGLDTVVDNEVPITTATNENNPAAFLDPLAGQLNANNVMYPHKVWLFWNSTRNGTADIYSETIDPQFEPRPAQ